MSCEWGYTDCRNQDTQCHVCVTPGMNYIAKAVKKKPQLAHRQQKADGRMGSSFEFKNHQANAAMIKGATSNMTPNSGAGRIKGDEQISGIIEIMEELKTKVKKQAPGRKTFTIEKEWLDKLNREAQQVNKEFWYLKFSFAEHDSDVYVIVEQDIIMSMVATIIADRRAVTTERLKANLAEKQRQKFEADLVAAQAEIAVLKAELELAKHVR